MRNNAGQTVPAWTTTQLPAIAVAIVLHGKPEAPQHEPRGLLRHA